MIGIRSIAVALLAGALWMSLPSDHATAQQPPATAAATAAKEPPTEPMLRIEPGGVAALPRAVAVDEDRGRIYTGGDDKAVRVWRREDLRLIDTWRLPSSGRNEGQINAMALSPDGRSLAVAGWTGTSWDGAMSIYVFDTSTGQIRTRFTGIPPVIGSLAFSPDGQYVAAGLVGKGMGVMVIRLADVTLALRDADFADSVLGVDFSANELAAVSLDGSLRIYDYRSGKLRVKATLKEGRNPTRVRFSPEGNSLAVGFLDVARVAVYSSTSLQPEWMPDASNVRGQLNLSLVSWSIDGKRLLAGGDPGTSLTSRVQEWQRGSNAPPRGIDVAYQRLSGLTPLRDGSTIVLAEDPLIEILRPDGSLMTTEASGLIDQRQASSSLVLADDASTARASIDGSREDILIDLTKLKVTREPARNTATPGAQPRPVAPSLARWKAGEATLAVGGANVPLEAYEFVRSVDAAPGGIVVGTEYGVRFIEANGKPRWLTEVGGVAWAARASRNGRFIVAAASDGTFRWMRASDGSLVVSVFVHKASGEWVAWTPEGYYASSPRGDELIGWQLNRTKRERADFYSASQFERLLYRPDIVKAALADAPPPLVRSATSAFEIRDLRAITPPRIEIISIVPDPSRPSRLVARFKATRTAAAMRGYTVFVDDIPITPASERGLRSNEGDTFIRDVTFTPFTTGGNLRIEVRTDQAIGVGSAPLPLMASAAGVGTPLTPGVLPGGGTTRTTGLDTIIKERPQGDLYLLSIGIREFPGLPKRFNLDYTERDAVEMSSLFDKQGGKAYRKVYTRTVSDTSTTKPTREAILESLQFLKQANANDTVILFLSSHGVRDERGNYYFAVADSRIEDLCRIVPGLARDMPGSCPADGPSRSFPGGGQVDSFLEWRVFFDAVGESAGRRLLIVDTCEAADIKGDTAETASLRKRSASSRFSLLLAAGDGEESQEYAAGQHGLFTYALLKALSGAAADASGEVSLESAYRYTRTEVDKLRDRRLGPMTPSLDASPLLRALPIASVGR